MLYLLALIAGGALCAGLYTRTSGAVGVDRTRLIVSGLAGATGGWLIAWLVQVGVSQALQTAGTVLVVLVILTTVAPVVLATVLGVRRVNDTRISYRLHHDRGRHAADVRSSDDR